MRHRTVGDVMSSAVVGVQRGTLFKEIVQVLHEHDVTAVPVLDGRGRPVGVVSEADLLRKPSGRAAGTGLPPSPREDPSELAKVEATTAEGLMTSPAVCARPGWSVVEAAGVMERHRVKRLPVVDDAGRLVGIVSRRDLLTVFLRRDRAITEEIVEEVLVRTMGQRPSAVSVHTQHGQVVLSGSVDRRSAVDDLVRLCLGVDGVVSVDHRLAYDSDDTVVR
ncbi:CBS domain-containing protein [Streptomyces sp. NPDC059506]|uniref:CBS domain-containing protein n=1 Tax=Streptomyces TaxID=1883 RepID=UPI000CB24AE0|nr:CBS domain-containing protein [Streptomyces sp. SCUT-3]PLW73597.1 inosine-5'-monophosphate dehydrogenase [Streptomyces sp. DJ]QMV24375.1 CBS domain-containing protein [Streptomyces sp. SCUT-3]